jgi:hypothetical protein
MRVDSLVPSRTLTFSSTNMLDVDALVTSIATAASITTFSGAGLNGVVPTTGLTLAGHSGIAQYPSITCSNSVGSFVLNSTCVFTATYGGEAVTRTATITSTAGNGTYIANGPIDVGSCTKAVLAAQVNTSGTVSLGLTDLACPKVNGAQSPICSIRAAAAGNVAVVYYGGFEEVIALDTYEREDLKVYRIRQATTTVGIRVYLQ